ncbi:arylamine N-acetyltransferase family protein [Gordonia sp. FQ]|uniref:arylamine N-acetyltransferase family protein n=1 Tax=Gordonia sp. FQ TaxID=3446634 RepID=UPI003F866335
MAERDVTFPTSAYLARIGLSPQVAAVSDPVALIRMCAAAQHATIAFENLDIHRGECVGVAPGALIARLIDGRRGGICYQLNGLLALALDALGVPVTLWGARVDSGAGEGPARGHMAVVAAPTPDRRLLVDVGFGGEAVTRPIDPSDPADLLVRLGGASYRLDPIDRNLDDFAEMARWHSSSPHSRFTGSVICTRPVGPGGRDTLTGRPDRPAGPIAYRLIEARGPRRTERALTRDAAEALLTSRFGMPDAVAPDTSYVVDHAYRQRVGNGSPR